MRDHVLLQAIARVNRPYIAPDGNRKRVGLVVDVVGVLRELKKALLFDSSDVSGAIEGLDELLTDFREKMAQATADYLDEPEDGADDERLEQVVYGRFLDPEGRKVFLTPTRTSRLFGKYSLHRRNSGTTSTLSSNWPNSIRLYGMLMQPVRPTWRTLPARPAEWCRSGLRRKAWVI